MQNVNAPMTLSDPSERRSRALVTRWIFGLASTVIGWIRVIFEAAVREPDNPFARISVPQTLIPEAASRYGVAVDDSVDISAMTPPIALHRATLTAMDNDRLTVRAGENIFTVRWENLIHLRKINSGR